MPKQPLRTSTYLATLCHHSLAVAPSVKITGTLSDAKRAATDRFGDGFRDHEIEIYDLRRGFGFKIVASRRLNARRWNNHI